MHWEREQLNNPDLHHRNRGGGQKDGYISWDKTRLCVIGE